MSVALSWMDQARCANEPEFVEAPVAIQKTICRRCPVQRECREFGTTTDSSAIVFGGKKFKSKGGRS